MPRMDADWISGGMRERHAGAAIAATVVSVLLHGLVLYKLPGLPLGMGYTPPPPAPRTESFRLHEVQAMPPREALQDLLPPASAIAGMPAAATDLTPPAPPSPELVEPRELPNEALSGEAGLVAEPPAPPEPAPWEPRQDVLQIEERVVRDEVSLTPRKLVPAVERMPDAPDIVLPADRATAGEPAGGEGLTIGLAQPDLPPAILPSGLDAAVAGLEPSDEPPGVAIPEGDAPAAAVSEGIAETYTDVSPARRLDDFLQAHVQVYETRSDRQYGYFRLTVRRKSAEVLPVLPKDVFFVQDCSASMSEQKLYFCRQGLARALTLLGPGDRFNVIAFRDATDACFPEPAPVNAETLARATRYIEGLEARGETDIFASLQQVLRLPHTPGRPSIVLLVTDGVPTTGVTDSSRIIESFSASNAAQRAVYTLGTIATANRYLLDLVSYRNRGDARVVTRGRWDIPDELVRRVEQFSQPVLSDMHLRFTTSGRCEVHPRQTPNLYADQPLELYGRYERGVTEVYCQVVGTAGELGGDMVFRIDLSGAAQGDATIRSEWGRHAVYHLIGEHTRTRSPTLVRTLRALAREYDVDIPYRDPF